MPEDVDRLTGEILKIFLRALGAAGLPGVSLVADAANLAIAELKKRRAWEEVKKALEQAEEEFRKEATQRGWGHLADAVLQLPLHDQPSLEKTLKTVLTKAEPKVLEAELREAMARLPSVRDPEQAAQAARLYAACILNELWKIEALRDAVHNLLFKDHVEALRRLEERLNRFLSWWRLPRMREYLPKNELVHGPERDISLAALKAPLALVPFTGERHEALRDEIVEWAENLGNARYHAGLRVLYGPGGAGKTRLAVEVATVLLEQGWEAFFLHPELLRVREREKDLMPTLRHFLAPPRPTLYVVDYVDHLPTDALRSLFRALHEAGDSRSQPVAMLLLMRPKSEPELINELTGLEEAEPGFSAFLSQVVAPAFRRAHEVPELSPEDRARLFDRAKEAFIELRGRATGKEVTYKSEDLPSHPLAVVLLGLLAAYGHRVARSDQEKAVLENLWVRWEKRKWRRVLENRGGGLSKDWIEDAVDHIEAALVAATLGRRFRTPAEAAAFWRSSYPFKRKDAAGRTLDPDWLASVLPKIFPGFGCDHSRPLPPIVPDPLADFVLARRTDLEKLARAALPIAEELREAWEHFEAPRERYEEVDIDEISRGKGHLFFMAPFQVLPVLKRLFDSYPEVGQVLAKTLSDWLEEMAANLPREAAVTWLQLWDHHLPESPQHTVALRELFVGYYRARLHWATEDEERAQWVNNLGITFSSLGRYKEALEPTREAVGIYRELAEKNPDRFLPDLATSLNNLGGILYELGQREKALETIEEAVEIRRELAEKNPDRFLPDLAASLNNLGGILYELGQREKALETIEEAVGIRRELAEKNPDRFLPDLATSLNNLGGILYELGQREKALETTEEAVGIYRKLAEKNPDRFLPNLARSLGSHGLALLGAGKALEAAEAFREGLRTLLPYARRLPQAFGLLLAALLRDYLHACNAADQAPAMGLVKEALQVLKKASGSEADVGMGDSSPQ